MNQKMRRKDREIEDITNIKAIVAESHVVRIAMYDEEYPYIVPTNYGYKWQDEEKLTLYIHGARQGKKLSCIKKNPHVCIEMDGKHQLIESGTKADMYSFAYQSFIGFGKAAVVNDFDEKKIALNLLMLHETGKGLESYDELSERAVMSTGIIKIELDSYTAKEQVHPEHM